MRYSPSPDFKEGRFFELPCHEFWKVCTLPPPFVTLIFKNGATCHCKKTVVVFKKGIDFLAHFSFTE